MEVHAIEKDETWFKKMKRKAKDKKEEIKYNWETKYKKPVTDAAKLAGFVGFITALGFISGTPKRIQVKHETELKERYIYDRTLGMYWHLRRKLKPLEKIEIENRRANHEPYSQILSDMKLI